MTDETPVLTDARRVSTACALTPPHRHSAELCDDFKGLREGYFGWKCECECHDG